VRKAKGKESTGELGRPLDEAALARVEQLLRSRPRTLAELVEAAGHGERTVFRWLRELEERGTPVRRANRGFPVLYEIG
jgi:DNA invertase Pin-like site-specific DNA recombinase